MYKKLENFFFSLFLLVFIYIFTQAYSFSYSYRKFDMNLDLKKRRINNKYAFVSCFYPIKTGVMRHSIEEYKNRISRLFNSFSKNLLLFIFTTNEGKEILQSSRIINGQNVPISSNIELITKYQSIFEIPQISKRKEQYREIAKIMETKSQYNISLEIGAIWTSKLVFLQEVIENYSKESKLFFWIDIGAIKTDELLNRIIDSEWPSTKRMDKILTFENNDQNQHNFSEKVYTNKVAFWGVVRPFLRPKSLDDVNLEAYELFIGAAFFGGARKTLISFLNEYWRIQDFLIKKKQFVLREEFMFAAYIALNKNDVFMIDLMKQKCSKYESFIGFISKSNICKFDNSVYLFATRKGKLIPVPKSLGDWL